MKHPSITIVRHATGWTVRVRGANGEILSSSEVLKSRASAVGNVISQREVWEALLNREIRTQFRDERTGRFKKYDATLERPRPTRKRRSKKR